MSLQSLCTVCFDSTAQTCHQSGSPDQLSTPPLPPSLISHLPCLLLSSQTISSPLLSSLACTQRSLPNLSLSLPSTAFIITGSQDLLVCCGKGHQTIPGPPPPVTLSPTLRAKTNNFKKPRIYATSVTVEFGNILLVGGWFSFSTSKVLAK